MIQREQGKQNVNSAENMMPQLYQYCIKTQLSRLELLLFGRELR